jgi:hypothetical protein
MSLPTPQRQPLRFELSSEIDAAVDEAPVGTFGMFFVDFARTAESLGKVPSRAGEVTEAVAGSKLWTGAARAIAQGALPKTATLYLAGQGEPIASMFGRFYGSRAGEAAADPSAGLWTLASSDAAVPHFLVRLTGPAAGNYTAALIGRAKAMGLAGTSQVDCPASHARLRMVPLSPPGGKADEELLVGTVQTLDEAGNSKASPDVRDRLRGLMKKVPTDRPVIGCARLDAARDRVGKATGLEPTPPPWAGREAVLVFSIDPRPDGQADLVLSNAPPDAFQDVASLAAPLAGVAEGRDIRLTGRGTDALEALANLLPGFQELALKALALAGEPSLPTETATQPAPKPERPPEPQPEPTPAPAKKIPFLCFNPQCTAGRSVFDVTAEGVSADVQAGTEALKCPHCGKPTAVVAVRCPHCQKWHAQTLDTCPHCNKPPK